MDEEKLFTNNDLFTMMIIITILITFMISSLFWITIGKDVIEYKIKFKDNLWYRYYLDNKTISEYKYDNNYTMINNTQFFIPYQIQ